MKHEILVSVRNPLIQAHQFDGRHLLPGLAYIDLLLQTFALFGFEPVMLDLCDLAIHRPLVVKPGRDLALVIEASPQAADEWQVEVRGRPAAHATSSWHRYAVATLSRRDCAPAFDEWLDWNAVQLAASVPVPMREIYQGSARHGLVHGDFMRAEGLVYTTDEAIYVDCQLGADARVDADALLFHPALIDACVVGATAILSTLSGHHHQAALPLSYARFSASRPLTGACMARVVRGSVRRQNELTWLSMDFFDLDGRKCAELHDFASKLLPPSGRLAEGEEDGDAAVIPSRAAPAAAAPSAALPLAEFLREAIARQFKLAATAIRSDTSFYELGIDSTGLLELAHAIQGWLGRKVPPTLLFQYSSIDEVVRHLGEAPLPMLAASVEPISDHAAAADSVPVVSRLGLGRKRSRHRGVAVIGLSGRYPQAATLEAFWERLCGGVDCITEIPRERWDADRDFDPRKGEPGKSYGKWGGFIEGVDAFDPLFFGMSPREAGYTDPQQRLFLETVWTLLESSGYTRERLRRGSAGRVGVYVGSMYSQYDQVQASTAVVQSFQSAIANRVSHYFGLNGPSVALDTMCSSFAVALHQACADLRRGDCALAIAGAVNLTLDGRKYVSLSQAQLLGSRADRRAFSDGDGYLPAEAVGAVLLKPLSRAQRDGDEIWGVIKATATNHAGGGQAYSVPGVQAQVEVMREVLRRGEAAPTSISYVEAAATGSALADAVEFSAIAQVLDGVPCAVGSVKSNIGHAEAASGVAQLSKVLLQLRHGALVPTIGVEPINPNLQLEETRLRLQREFGTWPRPVVEQDGVRRELPRRALINSFGAGGSNASVLVEEYRGAVAERPPAAVGAGPQVIVLSARSAAARRVVAGQLLDWLEHATDAAVPSLADLAYTLQEHREAMEYRLALAVDDVDALSDALRVYLQLEPLQLEQESDTACWHESDPQSVVTVWQTLSEESAQEMLRQAEAQGDLDRLALLWTQQLPVDWAGLRGAVAVRRLSLPTYPFQRARYWGPEAEAAVQAPGEADFYETDGARQFLVALLRRALNMPVEPLDATRPLREYGVDSVVGTSLVRAVNQRFGTRLGGRVLFEHPTLDALAGHLEVLHQSQPEVASVARIPGPPHPATDGVRKLLRDFKAGRLSGEQVKAQLAGSLAA